MSIPRKKYVILSKNILYDLYITMLRENSDKSNMVKGHDFYNQNILNKNIKHLQIQGNKYLKFYTAGKKTLTRVFPSHYKLLLS